MTPKSFQKPGKRHKYRTPIERQVMDKMIVKRIRKGQDMKNKMMKFVVVGIVILQVITLNRISNIQQELQDYESRMTVVSEQMMSLESNLPGDLKKLLKQQSSLLDSYGYEIGEINSKTLQVPIKFTVTLKSLSKEDVAILVVNDEDVDMHREGSSLKASVDVGLFESVEAKVILKNQEGQRAETLNLGNSNMRDRFIPVLRADYNVGTTYKNDQYILRGAVTFDQIMREAEGIHFTDTELRISVNGNLIDSIVADSINTIEDRSGVFRSGEFRLNDTYDLSQGETIRMTVVAKDSVGLAHCFVVHELTAGEGEPRMGIQQIIVNPRGEVLVGPVDFKLAD